MKSHWIIQCVGTSEEDQAHLRLLLRSARKHVGEDWVWGPESEADLLMMDTQSPIDDSAIVRASQPGVARVQLIDAGEEAPAGLFLRRPFHSEAFARLLAETAAKINEAEYTDTAVADPALAVPEPQVPPQPEDPAEPASGKPAEATAEENVTRWLLQYLPKRVLGGPAQIALPGAPLLVIDPESRMFWASSSLPELERYAREPLRTGDWKSLTTTELEEARKDLAARPFAQLIWMDSFIHSNGSLSRRFDPEGTYRLSKRFDLSNDYPRALRISAQMDRPRKLPEIARASGADIAEVFAVVNAYEAVGYLEWTRPAVATAPR